MFTNLDRKFAGVAFQWICNPGSSANKNKQGAYTPYDFFLCLGQAGLQERFPDGYLIQK